jgi:prepilin-type processing-associated H-X9-DG protein
VVIAIIAILAAILFPVFAQARAKARQAACLSNMKQIGTGLMLYTQDYDETYPVCNFSYGTAGGTVFHAAWTQHLQPYIKNVEVLRCPDARKTRMPTGTAQNDFVIVPGPGGAPAGSITVPRFQIGANEHIVNAINAVASGSLAPRSISMAAIGKPAEIALVADSTYAIFNDAARIMNANHTGNYYDPGYDPVPARARHTGGSTIVFGDGHAKWLPQGRMARDPDRIGRPIPSNTKAEWFYFKLPIHPLDDRLQ